MRGSEGSSSISHLLIHSSAWQCYFEMKTNMELHFSILSSLILWLNISVVFFNMITFSVVDFYLPVIFALRLRWHGQSDNDWLAFYRRTHAHAELGLRQCFNVATKY